MPVGLIKCRFHETPVELHESVKLLQWLLDFVSISFPEKGREKLQLRMIGRINGAKLNKKKVEDWCERILLAGCRNSHTARRPEWIFRELC